MADVTVNFKGDSRDLSKEADKAKSKLKEVGKEGQKAGKATKQGFKSATGEITDFSAGINLISTGLSALAISAKRSFATFEAEANRSLSAVNAVLNNFNVSIGNLPDVTFDSRDALVELGRDAEARMKELNQALDDRGLFTRLQENETILQGTAKAAAGIVGLFSDQFQASQGVTSSLVSQRDEQKKIAEFARDQLATLEARQRLLKAAGSAGAAITPGNLDQGPVTPGPKFITPGISAPDFSFGALPDSDSAFGGREFDESIAEATLNIRNFETAVKAGLVPSLEAMQGRTDLLRERLLTMIEQGVSPASVGFQQLQEQLRAAEAELQAVEASAFANEVAFTVFSDSAQEALEAIIFKTNSLNDALKNVGRRLLSTFLTAGVNVGIGAITGNPLSFGNALAGAVGIPVGASSAAPTADLSKATLSSSQLSSFGGAKVQVEATATRISGGDLLLTIQEAQNTRGTGGINIS